jgi:hypothetical protein
MNKLAILAVVVVTACSGKKSGDAHEGSNPVADDGKTCPMPGANQLYHPRFAVGSIPDYGVPDMRADHGSLCHEEFKPNDVLKIENGTPRIVAAGTFTGTCKESPGPRTYTAVKPAKLAIDIDALQSSDGELGRNKPLTLDSKAADKHAGVIASVVDRCGDNLETGASPQEVTWTPGAGCDKVVKLTPYDASGPAAKAREMQVFPVAPGTCTLSAEWLGVKGDISITVK